MLPSYDKGFVLSSCGKGFSDVLMSFDNKGNSTLVSACANCAFFIVGIGGKTDFESDGYFFEPFII